jgi:molecular chaperone DnaJ
LVLSSEKNLYEVLEISSTANAVLIKSAYRKLARKYHPDLNRGDELCVKKFKEISEAYEVLSDDEKKKNYDILRGFYQQNSQTKYTEAQKAYKETSKEKKQAQNDIFSNVLNDILEGFKKTASSSKEKSFKTKQMRPERGSDINTNLTISILEAIEGTIRTVNILHTEICPNCEGRTFLNGGKCSACKGLGEQSTHKKLNVKIPSGIKQGSKIRIANEGNKGYNGGRNGDLYLNIKIENSLNFKYDGTNVLCTVPITPFEAVLGATIEIYGVNGKISMKITPNTHCGQKFRIAGEGLEQDGKKGDMIITVNIEVPKNPSEKEIELYKKLRDVTDKDIRENK